MCVSMCTYNDMIQDNYILICVKLFYGNATACRDIKYNLMKYVLSFLKQHTMPIPSINSHGCSTGPSNLNSGQQPPPPPHHCPSPWLRQTTHKTL